MSVALSGAVMMEEYVEQAQVTDWPQRLILVGVVLAVIALALWAMRRGWRSRQLRQQDIPAPMDVPPQQWQLGESVPGLFAGTGMSGDWMNRIAVHDLGVRSRARLSWGGDGIFLEREGARSVVIPGGAVEGVRADRGVAGTVRAKDSMVVITWRLGDRLVDTGFRADASPDHTTVLDGLMAAFPTGVR
jgi:hypothetical protein